MSTTRKAHAIAVNAQTYAELHEWKMGRFTLETNRLCDSQYTVLSLDDVPPHRKKAAERLTVVDIEADTRAMYLDLSLWKDGALRCGPCIPLRARSRSPRRDEIKADSTSSRRAEALGYVAAHTFIRSEAETRMKVIITERDATIAKQAKLIVDLQAGKGLIGPVLKEAFPPSSMDDNFWRDRMERPEMKVSVIEYIKENNKVASNLSSRIMFGR